MEWDAEQSEDDGDIADVRDTLPMQDHTKLRVWERAHRLSVAVHELTETRSARRSPGVGNQLRRAVSSIAANIAEGTGQHSPAQFARFLQIAIGSASEALTHLLLMRDLQTIDADAWSATNEELQAVRAMLITLLHRVQERDARERNPSRASSST
jgi:four helix bundle protein